MCVFLIHCILHPLPFPWHFCLPDSIRFFLFPPPSPNLSSPPPRRSLPSHCLLHTRWHTSYYGAWGTAETAATTQWRNRTRRGKTRSTETSGKQTGEQNHSWSDWISGRLHLRARADERCHSLLYSGTHISDNTLYALKQAGKHSTGPHACV